MFPSIVFAATLVALCLGQDAGNSVRRLRLPSRQAELDKRDEKLRNEAFIKMAESMMKLIEIQQEHREAEMRARQIWIDSYVERSLIIENYLKKMDELKKRQEALWKEREERAKPTAPPVPIAEIQDAKVAAEKREWAARWAALREFAAVADPKPMPPRPTLVDVAWQDRLVFGWWCFFGGICVGGIFIGIPRAKS